MSYVRIDVNKPAGGGAPQSKGKNVVVWDVEDIATWPGPNSKGVLMESDIVMKPGKYATYIQGTQSSYKLPKTSEGEEDNVGFTSVPEFYIPGSSLEQEEFIYWATNRNLIVGFRVGACDGDDAYYSLYGTPCNSLSLIVEGQNDNEANRNMLRFQQFQKSKALPIRYTGTVTFSTVNAVPADATTVDVSAGTGRYQLADNAAATVITALTNASHGTVYTILGSGGANPATIESSNANFLLAGAVDWQGLAGTTLTLRAFAQDGGNFTFVEVNRS